MNGPMDFTLTKPRPRLAGVIKALWNLPLRFVELMLTWQERATARHRLLQMEDHLLTDIGVSREAALEEASKPFWR